MAPIMPRAPFEMPNDYDDFKAFLEQRETVANAYVNGEAAPLDAIVTSADPATFFSPGGGFVQGAGDVVARYDKDAGSFATGGKSHLEILHLGASDGLAYWVGFQHATARLGNNPDPIPMKLRITELFRREQGEWKLIHRHADTLVDEPSKKT